MRAQAVVPIEIDRSSWFVLRAYADGPRPSVLDLYPFATTSPIYVTVDGRPVRSLEDATYFLAWVDKVHEQVEAHAGWNTGAERVAVLDMIERARAEFERRR
jgi:hypothetical protein